MSNPTHVPDATFQTRVRDESIPGDNPFRWQELSSKDIFGGKKVVLFALPGAFTPTCSSNHLPRYDELFEEFKSHGVDQIICLSVNDAFVMFQWSKHLGTKNIFMLPDGNGEFTTALGLELDGTGFDLGHRSQRFAMIVEDGKVSHLNVEPGPGVDVSSAETMMALL